MKTPKLCVLAAALAAMASGCASVTFSSPHALDGVKIKGLEGKRPAEQVVIRTTGYYVLWTIPLVSGDLRWNPKTKSINGGFSLFDDQVGVNNLQEVLLKIAESRNCDLADVHFNDSDTFYDGMSSLFGSSDMSVSALLVPRNQSK